MESVLESVLVTINSEVNHDQEFGKYFRVASEEEKNSLEGVVGEEFTRKLADNGLNLYVTSRVESKKGVAVPKAVFFIPYEDRVIQLTVPTIAKNMEEKNIAWYFLFKDDLVNFEKRISGDSYESKKGQRFERENDKMTGRPLRFLKLNHQLLNNISKECTIEIKPKGRKRARFYERYLSELPNVKIIKENFLTRSYLD